MEIYIDATNLVLGRMCSYAAKKALLGNTIKILNCENAMVTGNRANVLEQYRHMRSMRTPTKGPFFPRMPDRFVRRSIRGMFPIRNARGKEAFKRVMCYIGVPSDFKAKKMITLPEADISKTRNLKYLTVKEICKDMGGNV